MSANPIRRAIEYLREEASTYPHLGDASEIADALERLVTDPPREVVERLAEISAQPGRPIGGGFYVQLTPGDRVRAVLKAIGGQP